MAPDESPRMAREAMITAVKAVGPEEMAALLALGRTSPQELVRTYADFGPCMRWRAGLLSHADLDELGSADVIDLKEARRRRGPAAKADKATNGET